MSPETDFSRNEIEAFDKGYRIIRSLEPCMILEYLTVKS